MFSTYVDGRSLKRVATKTIFFSRCFNVCFFLSAADADVAVATSIQRSRLVTFPVLLARFPLTSSPPTKSFALQFHFLMSVSLSLASTFSRFTTRIEPTLCVRVYCYKKILFRWPLSLSFFSVFFLLSSFGICCIVLDLSPILLCHSPIILHISLQIINFLNLIFLRALLLKMTYF